MMILWDRMINFSVSIKNKKSPQIWGLFYVKKLIQLTAHVPDIGSGVIANFVYGDFRAVFE